MRSDPDEWEGDKTEDDVGDELGGCNAGAFSHGIRDVRFDKRIEGHQYDVEALAAYPGLEAVPVMGVSAVLVKGG